MVIELHLKNKIMDAFEIHEILHKQTKNIVEVKPPINQNINIPDTGNILNKTASGPIQINKPNNPKPWKKIALSVGGVIALLYLLNKIPKNENYQNYTKRRQKRLEK